ncbi:882_t:CDS:2 [Funneliformis geosporum]|nr:882_t:CDS:2 [Funneliformis geosporum]
MSNFKATLNLMKFLFCCEEDPEIENNNDEVIPTIEIEEKASISHSTACEWLYMLGWEYKDHSKNIYFDVYEREDVVADRHRFLQQ